MQKWTEGELSVLLQNYTSVPTSDIMALLPGRAAVQIQRKANSIGLHKRPECRGGGMDWTASVVGHLSDAEKGYLAGLIDGEGCIMLCRHKSRCRTERWYYNLQVQITNTSPSIMAWLAEKVPGRVYQRRPGQRRPIHVWILAGNRKTVVFLREIAHLLVSKRPQAEALAEGYVHLSDDDRSAMFERIRAMKLCQ